VESLAPGAGRPVLVFRPSFPANSFGAVPLPMDFNVRPFRIVFAGRIEENKGVFDLLAIAERLSAQVNGRFEFSVCGDGPALAPLREQIRARGLNQVVKTHGRLARPELLARYTESHLVIVPTKSTFAEGFAMVVAEAILLLRPVLTSPVVPAGEVFGAAVAMAKTDDIESYAEQIDRLSKDERLYSQLVDGARQLRSTIMDDSTSLFATMRKVKASALG
jgi:glycosyltransferase involved in cell wall biosynthesis